MMTSIGAAFSQIESTDFSRINDKDGSIEASHCDETTQWNLFGRRFDFHPAINPNSGLRLVWDLLSMLLVVYDMGAIPFQLFEPESNLFFDLVAWTTRLFWTCDIPLSFLSGHTKPDGFIEMRLRMIALQYLRTWFVLDLIIVSADWGELVLGLSGGQQYARMGKASRVIRAVRMLRLLRMFRMWQVATGFTERLQSEKLSITLNMVKIVLATLAWSHVTACVWYGIGAMDPDTPRCWVNEFEVKDRSLSYRYLTSLHWSLAQFTGGMDELTPVNSAERVYAVLMFMCAFVMAGVFTSVLTSSMTRLHLLTSGHQQALATLRRYLKQSGISNRLAIRVQRNAQIGLTLQHVAESSVGLLELVSRPLRVEMHFEMFCPVLENHSFFARYVQDYPHIVRQLCHSAIQNMHVAVGDVIFNIGEANEQPKMYIVAHGSLVYAHLLGKITDVFEGDTVAEAVLWLKWTHQGTLTAKVDSDLVEMDGKRFQDIVPRFDHQLFCPWTYASSFVEAMEDQEEISDIMEQPSEEVVQVACQKLMVARGGTRGGSTWWGRG